VEKLFLENKALIGQANIAIRSQNRVDKWAELIENTARGKLFKKGITPDGILEALDLEGKVVASEIKEVGANFSSATKSAVFLKKSVETAPKCPICSGLILTEKSVSFDHIQPKKSGGLGDIDNAQITHPYCNSLKDN